MRSSTFIRLTMKVAGIAARAMLNVEMATVQSMVRKVNWRPDGNPGRFGRAINRSNFEMG
ncbi:hypothetical protein J2046_003781 [Rhizobium petrolearium]|nr:hypothetical protein [Neorhizobium petrolearium]